MNIVVAPRGLEAELRAELSRFSFPREGLMGRSWERLFAVPDDVRPMFAQNTWLDAQVLQFKSISEAVKHLRAIQRNWHLHSVNVHRRARLIEDGLPPFKPKPVNFPAAIPKAPLGAFTLIDENTMIYSPNCTSAFADGEVNFVENKSDPPSRAYLKLWEFFTVSGRLPKKGDRVLDVGSSPGGWTWVLERLGCEVLSVDKAPLVDSLMKSPRVQFRKESAFALDPQSVGQVDWLFSDIICYPDRLLSLIERWTPFAKNMVCTVKLQGETDFSALAPFQTSDAELRHLSCNKHELTWSRLKD